MSKTVRYTEPNPQSSHHQNERQPMEKVVGCHKLCLYDCSHKPEGLAGNLKCSGAAGLWKGTRSWGCSTEWIQTRKQNLTASKLSWSGKGGKKSGQYYRMDPDKETKTHTQHQIFTGYSIGKLKLQRLCQTQSSLHTLFLSQQWTMELVSPLLISWFLDLTSCKQFGSPQDESHIQNSFLPVQNTCHYMTSLSNSLLQY